jgi:hypothetical protein
MKMLTAPQNPAKPAPQTASDCPIEAAQNDDPGLDPEEHPWWPFCMLHGLGLPAYISLKLACESHNGNDQLTEAIEFLRGRAEGVTEGERFTKHLDSLGRLANRRYQYQFAWLDQNILHFAWALELLDTASDQQARGSRIEVTFSRAWQFMGIDSPETIVEEEFYNATLFSIDCSEPGAGLPKPEGCFLRGLDSFHCVIRTLVGDPSHHGPNGQELWLSFVRSCLDAFTVGVERPDEYVHGRECHESFMDGADERITAIRELVRI